MKVFSKLTRLAEQQRNRIKTISKFKRIRFIMRECKERDYKDADKAFADIMEVGNDRIRTCGIGKRKRHNRLFGCNANKGLWWLEDNLF